MNIKDYLEWRGDLSLKVSPFNDVDNMILCQAFYARFDSYIKDYKESLTLKELSDLYFTYHNESECENETDSPNILRLLGESERFKDARLHHFISIYNKKTTEQFAAAQIDLSDGSTFVVFRGTDDTLVGWKEDFKLAYEVIEAQMSASEYVLKYLKPFKKYIFAGHSKGGCLAIYAAMSLANNIQNNIQTIYSNDGPGLNQDYINKTEFQSIKDKIIKIVPEYDIIGTIYDSDDYRHIVVKSEVNPIMQHSMGNWDVKGTKLVLSSYSESSLLIKKGFKNFLNNVEVEKRKQFVLAVFKSMDELKIETLSQLSTVSFMQIINALKAISEMDESTKETANKFIEIFTSILEHKAKTTSDLISEKANQAKDEISEYIATKTKQIKKVKLK